MQRFVILFFIASLFVQSILFAPSLVLAQGVTCEKDQKPVSREGQSVCIYPSEAQTQSECAVFGAKYTLYRGHCNEYPDETLEAQKKSTPPTKAPSGPSSSAPSSNSSTKLGQCPDPNFVKIQGGLCVPKEKDFTGVDCSLAENSKKPICLNSFGALMASLIRYLLSFAGLVAVVFIVYGGYVYMTAGGESDGVTKGKEIITRAIIGLILVMVAWGIVSLVTSFVTEGVV